MAPATSLRLLAPLGCALLAALALILPGCGGEGMAAPEAATAPPSQGDSAGTTSKGDAGPAAKALRGGGCARQVHRFVDSLDTLRDQLAVGLSYEQYAAAVDELRASYDRIPVDRLPLGCLSATGTPSEQALNKHIDAVNAWGECLADASCTTAEIEPALQRKWRVASRFLSAAQ